MNIEPIAFAENDFTEKFGIPRQCGLTRLTTKISLLPEFADANAFRGLEEFTHVWLIWGFSEAEYKGFSPTVRPPRLGGNVRMGVFATRSPFRPNSLGLSVVKIEEINGCTLTVSGADLLNGTPIYDIKPYLPYADSIPEASNGWALSDKAPVLKVDFPEELQSLIPFSKLSGLIELLAQDPRPQYQDSSDRTYTMAFGKYQVSFRVSGDTLTVTEIR
ncbi:MAG: tRNA (N6-threonylcarbamoyladenosine(37)-N6)-methyltransferase TrmO [Oscillospiraceae bacterium]